MSQDPQSPPRSRYSIGATRSPEAHAAILGAAAEVLDERGYAGFTIEAVARRAGSSKPTIYRWWPNKAALIMEVYERGGEAPLAIDETGDLEADLTLFLERLWTWWRDTRAGEVLRTVIAEAQLAGVADELRDAFLPRRRAPLVRLLHAAQERGEISAEADIEAAVTALTAGGWLQLLTADLDQTALSGRLVRLVVAGLKAQGT